MKPQKLYTITLPTGQVVTVKAKDKWDAIQKAHDSIKAPE